MDFEYEWIGEHALLLRFGEGIDPATNERVHEACRRLRRARSAAWQELVPAYASVLLRYRPGHPAASSPGASERSLADLREALACAGTAVATAPRLHRLPVCYGGSQGCDLPEVAEHLRLSPSEVIARHCAAEYTVAMLGFAPGFAYLLGMDTALQMPRRARPRTRVPAGSVGIGGAQTGIYPAELPGGWQLIGRTPWRLFDADQADRPCRLAPGDRVRFHAIDADEFTLLQSQEAPW